MCSDFAPICSLFSRAVERLTDHLEVASAPWQAAHVLLGLLVAPPPEARDAAVTAGCSSTSGLLRLLLEAFIAEPERQAGHPSTVPFRSLKYCAAYFPDPTLLRPEFWII
eukprot:TRINITY_DN1935_c0_g1_i10.p1 TRINITY_DN1935_c0_g1~~TRINITY_DN1935_c0_g1_i10.p1  ORF type:complete len:110 (-),score=9.31 TRINITY_DN1935_c0_g1_i10:3-332(-)